jgi:hypothetical protein
LCYVSKETKTGREVINGRTYVTDFDDSVRLGLLLACHVPEGEVLDIARSSTKSSLHLCYLGLIHVLLIDLALNGHTLFHLLLNLLSLLIQELLHLMAIELTMLDLVGKWAMSLLLGMDLRLRMVLLVICPCELRSSSQGLVSHRRKHVWTSSIP